MRKVSSKIPSLSLIVLVALALFSGVAYKYQASRSTSLEPQEILNRNVFSANYPVAPRFQEELDRLRQTDRLSSKNEALIDFSVSRASQTLKQPPALLWCLLFQESRLDHLSGIQKESFISGLGQFSQSAFYEINKDLSRYHSIPSKTWIALLGKDVRPISPDKSNPSAPHSYYHIPTAVSASALFLYNRWIQLQRVAFAQNLAFSPEILWMWAALSYNKGGRSILSIWKQIEKEQGRPALQAALQQRDPFLKSIQSSALIQRALLNIWKENKASIFARELSIHTKNLTDCAFVSKTETEQEKP